MLAERPPSQDDAVALQESIGRGLALLGLPPEADVDAIQVAIPGLLNRLASEDDDATDAACWDVGTVWGDTVVCRAGWQWVVVTIGDTDAPSIVTPNRSHIVVPPVFMLGQLEMCQKGRDVTTRLLFNMLVAGNLPPAAAGGLMPVS